MRRPISLPPLDNITDPQARAAFRALVDHFAKTDYLAASDFLEASRQANTANGGRTAGVPLQPGTRDPGVWNRPPYPGEVGAIISFLENQIRASALFRELGTRIDLIDRPNDGLVFRIGNAEGSIRANGAALQGIGSEIYDQIIPRLSGYDTSILHLETQLSQFGEVVGLVQESTYTAANSLTSLAQWSITTQATIGQIGDNVDGLKVSVQTAQVAQANVNGTMLARWTVRMDLNGHVSGFGMEASGTRQHVESMFLVRATTFAIAGTEEVSNEYLTPPVRGVGLGVPADETMEQWQARVNAWGDAIVAENNAAVTAAMNAPQQLPGEPDNVYAVRLATYNLEHFPNGVVSVPFIVKTQWWTDDAGIEQPPGVYMRRAMIERLVVDTAYIRDASVTTLKVRGQAITVPIAGVDTEPRQLSKTNWTGIWAAADINHGVDETLPFFLQATLTMERMDGGDGNYVDFMVTLDTWDNPPILRRVGYGNNVNGVALPFAGVVNIPPGYHTIVIWARENGADLPNNSYTRETAASLLGVKR